MARIRTIKPEFWDSPGTARASLRARLFFIAMWNWADDWGVGDAHPMRLLSFAFPNDESSDIEPRNFRRLAKEVSECFDVQWYEVDGRAYYAIPSWEEHQRTEKKARRKNPGPDQALSFLYEEESENPPPSVGHSAVERRSEEGKGKGEEGSGKRETGNPTPMARVSESDFEAAYSHWPKKAEKKKSYEKFVRLIESGVCDLETLTADIIRFGDAYRAYSEKQYTPALVVWLNGERWTDDLPEPRQARSTPQPQSRAEQNLVAYWKEFGDDPAGGMAAIGS